MIFNSRDIKEAARTLRSSSSELRDEFRKRHLWSHLAELKQLDKQVQEVYSNQKFELAGSQESV